MYLLHFGFNAKTEKYENLYKSGVIDPAKVVRIALEHAASVAGMLLTTECVIADIPEDELRGSPVPLRLRATPERCGVLLHTRRGDAQLADGSAHAHVCHDMRCSLKVSPLRSLTDLLFWRHVPEAPAVAFHSSEV